MLGPYGKLIAAIFGAVIMYLYQATSEPGPLDVYDWIQTGSAAVGAFLVWIVANGPKGSAWHYAKTIALGVTAVLATLIVTLPNGVTAHEAIELLISFATGVGVLTLGRTAEFAPISSTVAGRGGGAVGGS
jgi:hypothetical protein